MRNAFVSEGEARAAGLATGYFQWFGVPLPTAMPYVPGGLASGFMIASAEDMTHALIAH